MKTQFARLATALLVAAALMATAASAAQAHEWRINEETMKTRGLPSEQLTISKAARFHFDVNIFGVHSYWTCSASLTGGSIILGGSGRTTFSFRECDVEKPSQCSIISTVEPKLQTELIEVTKKLYLKFLPPEGAEYERLFRFEFQEGSVPGACAGLADVGAEFPFQGSFAGSIAAPTTEAVSHALEFSPAINAAAGANLHVGGWEATMSGGYTSALGGGHAGENWSVAE